MKLIIDISEEDRKDIGNIHFVREDLKFKIGKAIMNGTPLDDVKAEIAKEIIPRNSDDYDHDAMYQNCGLRIALKIIDNVEKGE